MKLTLRNRATLLAIAVGLSGFVVIACQQKLPTAPSDLMTGIAIYEHANFLGASSQVVNDISDLKDFRGLARWAERLHFLDQSAPAMRQPARTWSSRA